MHLVINNFWNYFQVDIAQALWSNLTKALECEKDFEGISISLYLKTSSRQSTNTLNPSKSCTSSTLQKSKRKSTKSSKKQNPLWFSSTICTFL
jgi:hypothetical protein